MESQKVTPMDERIEIIQDVIDRLLYLSPEEMARYKETLSLLHSAYKVSVQKVDGTRIYSPNKNVKQ